MKHLVQIENIIFVMVMLSPIIFFLIFKPIRPNFPSKKTCGWKIIKCVEIISRLFILWFCLLSPISLTGSLKYIILVLMVLVIVTYYMGWIRYITHDQLYIMLYQPLFGIPLPIATLPCLFWLLTACLIQSKEMVISSLIFTIVHLLESNRIYQQLRFYSQQKDV